MAENRFDSAKFKSERKTAKWIGSGLILFAIIDLIDMNRPIPIPLTGRWAVFTAIIALIPGVYFFLKGFGTPSMDVVMQVAQKHNSYLTFVVMLKQLGLSPNIIEETLRNLWKKGYLEVASVDIPRGAELTNPTPTPVDEMPLNRIVFKFIGVPDGRTIRPQQPQTQPIPPVDNVDRRDIDGVNRALLEGNLGVDGLPRL